MFNGLYWKYKLNFSPMNQPHGNEVELFCATLFHNILNPLTVISLEMDNQQRKGPVLQLQMDTIIHHLTHLEYFVSMVCENIKPNFFIKKFSVNEEIEQILEILAYKAKRANVQLLSLLLQEVSFHANQLKFHQLLLQTFLFFIEAAGISEIPSYEELDKKIEITLEKKKKDFYISFNISHISFEMEKLLELEKQFQTEFKSRGWMRKEKDMKEWVMRFSEI